MIARLAKIVVSLCGASAVLAFGAWMGGALTPARAEAPARPHRVTDDLAYSGNGEIAVGDALEVNGQPMQLSVFYTSDKPEQVGIFYADAFAARGVIPVVGDDPKMVHVSGFDPKDGFERFISATPQPDGQTLVLVGVTNPRRPPQFTRGAAQASFPVPAENRAFMGYKSNDAGSEAESAQYVSSLSTSEIVAFYRKELPGRGWAERRDDTNGALAVFAKDGSILSVAVQALDDKRGSAVFVNRTSGGSR